MGLKGESQQEKPHSKELHDLYFSPNLVSNLIKKGEVSRECGIYRGEDKGTQDLEGKQ